jgi:hypothetical protein
MDEIPFYKRPWFFITSWLVFLGAFYFWQIHRLGGVSANRSTIVQDFFLFLLFFLLWMAFFSQFVLPVNKFRDRQKIFDRVFRHMTRSHGPAIFVENGIIKEHPQETLQKGPGVVWLDSASAGVTRSAVAIKKVIGPGVHFTDTNEYIDEKSGTLDLHTQTQKIGPKDGEKFFEEKKEGQSQEQFDDLQKRRRQVSALTRDGIELVPEISIMFRVNTGFPAKGEPGSRFGYRTGNTRDSKIFEQEDQDVIRRAIFGEGINPNIDPESIQHRVAWNRLPAMLATDVWREYAAKFTLDEIFNPTQPVALPPEKPLVPTYDETAALDSPSKAAPMATQNRGFFNRFLRDINNSIEGTINSLEQRDGSKASGTTATTTAASATSSVATPPANKTALQVINEMLKARLTHSTVDILDEYGKRKKGQVESIEYRILQERGLKVMSVSVSNVRVHPTIQESLIKQWKANWLRFAKGESELLDLKRNLIESAAQEKAQCKYSVRLSQDIMATYKPGKATVEELLKSILLRTRAMIRSGELSNSLRRRMTTELQDIEDTIQWMGEDGK